MMEKLKFKPIFWGFLAVMMTVISLISCKQMPIPEVGQNPTGLENQNLEEKVIYKEFIGYIFFFETVDSARHHLIGIGMDDSYPRHRLDKPHPDSLLMSPVGYRLDKQNPETVDFIQLIKNAEKDNVIEPLKVILKESESGRWYITKIVKISEAEEKKWKESGKRSRPTPISN